MKTPEQWLEEVQWDTVQSTEHWLALIQAIQKDAAEHSPGMVAAMHIIEKVGTTGIEHAYPQAVTWLTTHFPEHV